MKKLTFILVTLFVSITLNAQELIAEYPLYQNGKDVTGNNTDMTIMHAPFQYEAIYSNGLYYGSHADGSHIQSPIIENFDFENFSFSLNFKIDEYSEGQMPVIMCGSGWRWLSVIIEDSMIGMVANDGADIVMSEFKIELDSWYLLGVSYNKTEGEAKIYLGGYLLKTLPVNELAHGDEASFVNSNGGIGITFKGYWRFFKIFNSEEAAGIDPGQLHKKVSITSFNQTIIVDVKDISDGNLLELFDLSGRKIGQYKLGSGENRILSPVSNEIIIVSVSNRLGQVVTKKISL